MVLWRRGSHSFVVEGLGIGVMVQYGMCLLVCLAGWFECWICWCYFEDGLGMTCTEVVVW